MGHEAMRLVGDVGTPELVGATLVEGQSLDHHRSGTESSQKVGGVGQSDRHLLPVGNRRACPDARRALDGGGIDATADDSPGRVMGGTESDVPSDLRTGDLVDNEPGTLDK